METSERESAGRIRGHVPRSLRAMLANAGEHHTLTLAAGLAFFGILSIGPAVGVGFGLVRLAISPDAAERMVDMLQRTAPEQLGLGDMLEQMEDRAARYAGIGVAVLFWPATTLAGGWARALDAISGAEAPPGVGGLRGRLHGLVPGGIFVAGLFMLLAAATFATALAGDGQLILLVSVLVAAVVLQFLINLAIYRWLPSAPRPLGALWPGAAWATVGVVVTTAGFAAALALGEGLAQHYPPALSTAIILGVWLYAANAALLLGAEYNEVKSGR